jgi:hypothetical protein
VESSTSATAPGLGDDIGPIGQRRRIDDLVHLAVALAPDEFARIIDGDDVRHEGEAAVQYLIISG